MPPFKDDQIMVCFLHGYGFITNSSQIIQPGTHTTLAQLGLPESFTPAQFRVKTRMFPAEKEGEWEAYKVRRREKKKHVIEDQQAQANGSEGAGGANGMNGANGEHDDLEYYED